MDLTSGQGADVVFETAGNKVTTQQTAKLVKKGGTIVLVGYTTDGIVPMHINTLLDREITVKTVFRYKNIYPTAIKAVAEGLVPLKKIVSDVFPFEDVQKAMEHSIKNKSAIIKSVIKF